MKKRTHIEVVIPNSPLKRGDRCLGVMYLQVALQAVDKSKPDVIKENGVFGPDTELKLRKFQDKNHIHVDGRYTDFTRRVLREVLKCK